MKGRDHLGGIGVDGEFSEQLSDYELLKKELLHG
jgi:hypothetical protein